MASHARMRPDAAGSSREAEADSRPHSPAGRSEAARVATRIGNAAFSRLVAARGMLAREPAQDIRECHDFGGLNLDEEKLGARLAGYVRAGNPGAASAVLAHPDLEDYNRDDVARAMVSGASPLTTREIIRTARVDAGAELLRRIRGDVGSGWESAEDFDLGQLIDAVLGDQPARNLLNRQRILALKGSAGTDLAALAACFEDDVIIDDDTVAGRLTSVLAVTEHLVIPGLQTGIGFGDTGFAGSPEPGGPGFRDPHPSSQNQVGHFLTAVGLRVAPGVVSRTIPIFGSIRQMIGAPAGMNDDDVALRLTIGHEKQPDPAGGVDVLIDLIATGFIESLVPGPEGETEEQRNERIGRALAERLQRNIEEIIAAFRAQFESTTDDDIAAWNEALEAMRTGDGYDPAVQEGAGSPLGRIAVGAGKGNSQQDLRLSMVGYRFGEMVQGGEFATRAEAAGWLRLNLGPQPAP